MVMSLPLLAQTSGFSGGVGGLVARSGSVAKVVLFLLVVFSLISWAIIIYKGMALHRAHAQSETFRPTVKSLESLSRSLARAATVEVTRLERRLSFLATTASVTPFMGLFGTVWGIMTAFDDIGRMGSANLAVVAPGISEALITTAAGLGAAIPAAVFFNYYSSRVRVLTAMMDDFAMEFLNIVERNFT